MKITMTIEDSRGRRFEPKDFEIKSEPMIADYPAPVKKLRRRRSAKRGKK